MSARTADPSARFFEELATRGHEPLLRKASGCVRFEVGDGRKVRRWFVTIDDGDVRVSREKAEAQCGVRVDRAVFDKIVTGRMNGVAAVLRGDMAVEGDWRLLVRMQRLFPSPRRRGGTR